MRHGPLTPAAAKPPNSVPGLTATTSADTLTKIYHESVERRF